MSRKKLSRRDFLRAGTAGAAGLVLAACQTEKEVTREVEKVVKETVVEKETVEVEKVVEVTSVPPPKEPVPITYITHWAGEDAHGPIMERLVEKFADAHPEIALDAQLNPDWAAVRQKYQSMCAANQCPDAGFDGHTGGPNAVDAGRLLPADDFVEAHKDIIDFGQMGAKYNDHYWSGFSEELWAYVVVYSKSLLAEIGLDEFPKTWDDLLAAGEAVKSAGKVLTSLSNWTNYILFLYIQQATDEGLQAFLDGDWGSPTWLESMKHIEELLPYLDENDLEHDAGSIPLAVADGSMLFDINGSWIMGNLNMDIEAVPNAIGCAPMPTPGGPLMIGGSGYAIGNTAFNTGHPDRIAAVWTFFDYWITDEEIVKGFITDAKSPMGVHTEWITEENCGPALWTFMGPLVYEGDKGFQEIGPWTKAPGGGVQAAFDAMRLGENAEGALDEFLAVIEG